MPEGDTIRRIAAALAALVGEVVTASSPHPRGRVTGVAAAIDGRRLVDVATSGKNLILRFDGGVIVRSHLRMSGRWRVEPSSRPLRGRPWLVIETDAWRASQWNGPILAVERRPGRGFAPDLLAEAVDMDAVVARFRAVDQSTTIGEALVDQRTVAGIGNLWLAELLWQVEVSPRATLRSVSDAILGEGLEWARQAMLAAVSDGRPAARVYGRVGRGCPRCGAAIVAFPLGEHQRTMYACPSCQPSP